MKYARIIKNKVIETIDFDPAGKFHPSIMFIQVDDAIEQHYETNDGKVFKAPIVAEVIKKDAEEIFPVLPVIKLKLCFTFAERRAIYALKDAGDERAIDWLSIIDDQRCHEIDLGTTWAKETVNYFIGKIDGFDNIRAKNVLAGKSF